jgi:hypothetical protein
VKQVAAITQVPLNPGVDLSIAPSGWVVDGISICHVSSPAAAPRNKSRGKTRPPSGPAVAVGIGLSRRSGERLIGRGLHISCLHEVGEGSCLLRDSFSSTRVSDVRCHRQTTCALSRRQASIIMAIPPCRLHQHEVFSAPSDSTTIVINTAFRTCISSEFHVSLASGRMSACTLTWSLLMTHTLQADLKNSTTRLSPAWQESVFKPSHASCTLSYSQGLRSRSLNLLLSFHHHLKSIQCACWTSETLWHWPFPSPTDHEASPILRPRGAVQIEILRQLVHGKAR